MWPSLTTELSAEVKINGNWPQGVCNVGPVLITQGSLHSEGSKPEQGLRPSSPSF